MESSRASTTRRMPSRWAMATPSALVIDICVEACRGKSGAMERINRAAPRSCTMAASTPAETTARTDRSSRSNSLGKTSVLRVDETADAAEVQVGHELRQFFQGEVRGLGPRVQSHAEAEVDGIRAVFHGRPGAVEIAGGGEEFGAIEGRSTH